MKNFNYILLIISVVVASFMTTTVSSQNIMAGWDGSGATGAGSEPNNFGWLGATTWATADAGSGVRFMTVSHNIESGGKYNGRLLPIRWDSSGGTTTSTIFSFRNAIGSITPMRLTPGKYMFTWLYEWFNNATSPTLTVAVATNNTGTGAIVSQDFVCSSEKNLLRKGTIVFDVTIENNYYVSIKNKSANASMCGAAGFELTKLSEVILTDVDYVLMDEVNKTASFAVTGIELASEIEISAPQGFSVNKTSLPANANKTAVTVTFEGTGVQRDFITLKSGNIIKTLRVIALKNTDCFTPLYPTGNIVTDPYVNDINKFGGWGSKSIVSDSAFVYCGSRCGLITGGSIDVKFSMKANTKYRVKAMVWANTADAVMGVNGHGTAGGDLNYKITTLKQWIPFEFSYWTGSNPDQTNGGVFFNNSSGSMIDNWEIYEATSIDVSKDKIALDETYRSTTVIVTNQKLTEDIQVIAPAGITVEPSVISIQNKTATITVRYDGTTSVNGDIILRSGEVTATITVKSIQTNGCYAPVLSLPNLVPDPNLNDLSLFGGFGTRESVTILATPVVSGVPYCGASSVKIGDGTNACSGGISLENINWEENAVYRIIAKVKMIGTLNMVLTGVDGEGTSRNLQIPTTSNTWGYVDHSFITGTGAVKGACTFNNCEGSTAKVAYIDNWEIYKVAKE